MPAMRLFPRRPRHLPLALPRLDGTGWPDPAAVGRPSFDTSTFYELACRNAYETEAHEVADRLVGAILPQVPTGVSARDEPYLRKVFHTAARIGAGLAMVERTLPTPDPRSVDRRIAGALWQARRRQPVMSPDWARTAAYFLLAGYYVARTSPEVIPSLVREVTSPPDPA